MENRLQQVEMEDEMPEEIIYFVKENPEMGFLSNFYPAAFQLGGNVWLTSEHYYQAHKFLGTKEEIFNKIKYASTPGKAKRIGGMNSPIREDWEEVKENIMLQALRAKFGPTHLDLRNRLLWTKNATLVEFAPWGDTYWGVDSTLNGLNRLGHLLMQVRNEIRKTADQQTMPFETKGE